MFNKKNRSAVFTVSPARGATLIELISFIVIVGLAFAGVVAVFSQFIVSSNDPLIRVRALELAQAQLDDVLARKFDENTPAGGVPACNASGGPVCAGITVPDSAYDDVGDFHGFSDNSHAPYVIQVTVTEAGSDLGLTNNQARLISVRVSTPATGASALGSPVTLSAYKVNF
ncbi:type IV pilus modification PilV family protein [Agaribacterium haliotis]|uniref:type IV pilus modification PilV family protein n=1 Tax=Agaribacterium haliotis TaxID=2013869 RepID=UPI001EFC3326|nr:type II secretion system protein [Agaribacterium haliotis]